ncbi:MAG TPA: glycosyl hydrolase, partial [Bacillota bacterium]|nr:glycosyl hydrolase [Bacillota bacterium]
GPRLELFIDGVLVDEEWPAGQLRTAETIPCLLGAEVDANNAVQGRFHGLIDHAALWRRALSDEEIVLLSGGKAAVARATRQLLGPEDLSVQEFWKPRGDLAVGDCMPFFDGHRWHLYYLQDRHGHRSKWGLGAHQWAHISTADFKTWQPHPMAVPINDSREGSICTGSVFLHLGEYLAYYAVRTCDGSPAPLSLAVSSNGIDFTKQAWTQTLSAPYAGGPARDPHVFQDPRDQSFHMLVTTSLEGKTGNERGCLAHLVSSDLRLWEQRPPFLVPGLPGEPECAEWWGWNGWFYLVFSNGGVARYRMARDPLGPWITPAVPAFDGNQCVVMKSAPFRNGRRIGAAFLPRSGGGYAGNVLFRELGQQPDGTLTTRFVRELMPKAAKPIKMQFQSGQTNAIVAGSSPVSFTGLPQNLHLSALLHPAAGTQAYGLRLRTGPENTPIEVRFLPAQQRIEVKNGAVLESVAGLGQAITIELFLKDDMLDLCLNNQRTLASRVASKHGHGLVFFSEGVETRLETLEVRPLVDTAQ